MQEQRATGKARHRSGALPVCLLLSLLAHGTLAAILVLTIPQSAPPTYNKDGDKKYRLTLTRPQKKGTQKSTEQAEKRPFIKTDSERPQLKPKEAEFEGARDARAEGMEIKNRQDNTPAPTMEGEIKEERNVLEQKRQDGDVQHEDKITQVTPQEAKSTETETESADTPSTPQEDTLPVTEAPLTPPQASQMAPEQEQSRETAPAEPAPHETDVTETTTEQAEPPPPAPQASLYPQHSGKRRPVYDPSQAPHAQAPGLKTEEKRSRSTGRFVIGKRPSWDVEATPRGEYESLVYRLIAAKWYFACDRHRGDITPGTLIILLRLDTKGRIVDMKRVSKRGAGILQESFTFNAIRQAQFPPMPPEVIKSLIGEQMEFFITFDFN